MSWLKTRCTWGEASGSWGDIGTFLPLLVRRICSNLATQAVAIPHAEFYKSDLDLICLSLQVGLTKAVGLDLGTSLIFTGQNSVSCQAGQSSKPLC